MRAAFALRIFSGRIIYIFGFQKRLRAFLKPIFTGGVVKGKRHLQRLLPTEATALRGEFLLSCSGLHPHPSAPVGRSHLPPAGGRLWRSRILYALAGSFTAMPRALPLGELASAARLRGRACKKYQTQKQGCCTRFCAAALFPTYIRSSTFFPVSGSGMPSSARMIAMRIYTPLCT